MTDSKPSANPASERARASIEEAIGIVMGDRPGKARGQAQIDAGPKAALSKKRQQTAASTEGE